MKTFLPLTDMLEDTAESELAMCLSSVRKGHLTQNQPCIKSCGRHNSTDDCVSRCFKEVKGIEENSDHYSYFFPIAKKGDFFCRLFVFLSEDGRLIFHHPLPKEMQKFIYDLKKLGLTDRELIIVGYLREGYTRDSITSFLDIKKNTLKTHVKNIYGKIPVKYRKYLQLNDAEYI